MNELAVFVKDSLAAGHSREETASVLAQAGWPEDEVREALARYAEIPFPIPVPKRRQSASAREAFLYLVTFLALYISAISIGSLIYGLIDHFVTDPLADTYYNGYENDSLRWNIAAIVVSFPLYLVFTRMHLRSYALDPERRGSSVRRWLTYLTLFAASCVVIATLIMLIGGVLGGELFNRFFLKVVTALVMATGVLVYYLWEMRLSETPARGGQSVKAPRGIGREARA